MADKNLSSITFPGLPDKYKVAQVADEYSSSSTYAVGDIVNYLGTTYRCTTAITTAENWTAGHWAPVKIAKEVTDLKSANAYNVITDAVYKTKNNYDIHWEMNKDHSVSVSGTASGTSLYDFFSSPNSFPSWATPGNTYHYKFEAENSDTVWALAKVYLPDNSTPNILDVWPGSGRFTIPNNAVGFIIRLGVSSGKTVNETVKLTVWNTLTNGQIKEEIENIKNDLIYITKGGKKYENVSVQTGQYVKSADGTIASYPSLTTWATSQLYRIPKGTYEIQSNFNEGVGASTSSGFAVYDSNMVFIIGGRSLSELVIGEGYAFIRLTNYSSTSDHSNLYVEFKVSELINQIPVLDDKIDKVSDRTDLIMSRGKYAVDKVSAFRDSFATKSIVDDSTGASFIDADNYTNSNIRLTTYRTTFTFDSDVTIYSNTGYVFKIITCNSSGGIVNCGDSWVSEYTLTAGNYYGIVMKHSDDSSISVEEAINLYSDIANKTIEKLDENIRNEIVYGDNLGKYYDFYFKSIDTDNEIEFGGNSGERRSTIFSTTKPFTITMNNADYVFRMYWYEDDLLYSYGWGRVWDVPINQTVGLSIKKANSTAFLATETPEKYMTIYHVDDAPKDYFLTEIENTISDIRNEYTEPGLCFFLTTDQHTMSVQSPMKYDTISDMVVNMREIAKHVHVDGLISLGDIADFKVGTEAALNAIGIADQSYANLDNAFYKIMDDAMTKMASVHPDFYYVLGNHDDNRYINRDKVQASESAYDYTPEELYAYYGSRGTHDVVYNTDNNGLDYYVDFSQFKIRMFFIDANYYNETSQTSGYAYTKAWWYGFSDSTVSWLEDQLEIVPNDWSVIICSHLSPFKEHNEDNTEFRNFANIRNAIQTFINGGGDYIATLYGHTHGDWSATSPWLEISFACQKCENYNVTLENMPGIVFPTRTVGTYTEDCWSVVLILPESRKIKIIRFGAGSNMTFTY